MKWDLKLQFLCLLSQENRQKFYISQLILLIVCSQGVQKGEGIEGRNDCNSQLWESLHRWFMINNVEPSHFCQINCVFIFLWLISHLIKHLANQNEALKVNHEFARWSLTHKRAKGVTSVCCSVCMCVDVEFGMMRWVTLLFKIA